jgi:DNA primase
MFDGDSAGVKAALRGVDLILKEGMNVRIVLLPEEHDPDTFARANSSEQLRAYINDNAQDFLAFKARLLLGEATNDPLKRTDAINDMVYSISLIPDHIKRSEYIRYCSEIMNVDQQTLAVAVARKVDGVGGDREAQDFLRRQQFREHQQATPSSLYVAQPQQQLGQPSSKVELSGGTTPETLERELTKYLIKYGHLSYQELDGREVHDINVAQFIFEELDQDGLQFEIEVYRTILECYREEWKRLGVGEEVPMHIFINHHNPEVSRVSIELLTSDDSYVISKIWEQKEVHIESDEEQLAEGVPKAMVLYKLRTIDKRIAELIARMAAGEDDEDLVSLVAKYQGVRVEIARTIGRLI